METLHNEMIEGICKHMPINYLQNFIEYSKRNFNMSKTELNLRRKANVLRWIHKALKNDTDTVPNRKLF